MAGPQDVIAKADEALAAVARCQSSDTTRNYEALAEDLQELAELAQRSCQEHLNYRALVGKLRAGDALSDDEKATLRRLMVGDADYYLKYDEEFDRCKSEIAKIVGEIGRLKAGELSADTLMHLSVLCREAGSLMAPTQHYLEARDRVRSFEAATAGTLRSDDARALAGIIERMVA